MTKAQKIKLEKHFFTTDKIRSFLCNDFYQEIKHIIPDEICISEDNLEPRLRLNNATSVYISLTDFLDKNKNYSDLIAELYNIKPQENYKVLNELIEGYLFFLSLTEEKFKDIDIYKDEKSICYSPIISTLDIL